MQRSIRLIPTALILAIGIAVGSTAAPAQSSAPTPSPPTASNTPSPVSPAIVAKDIQGLDVFGSDGQQVGKIAKVNVVPEGNVKDVEVQSGGFLGFFSKTYVVPADKLNKKGGRVELSMTSEQAKQLIK
jgi:sporulation protein YlmC with PRC-barrel domain